ncbi:MAG: hypothetical protein KF682_05905 [Nitrospira sp.]|nr:hypothetical protein [Nitrospira sp.]
MRRKKIVIPLPLDLKKQLDAKRKEGYTLVGYVTKVLRKALGGRAA